MLFLPVAASSNKLKLQRKIHLAILHKFIYHFVFYLSRVSCVLHTIRRRTIKKLFSRKKLCKKKNQVKKATFEIDISNYILNILFTRKICFAFSRSFFFAYT